ncbi:DUF1003 domain-containing protein [Ktedonosporobacter rubrisoli]|uniref:DUF1003 domain-containing protein n=1 Tax=Ktedonosporobacter rubrisoli TaxID=2509675 RepID=A0A4P6JQH1_KTERU|nr:DUF1003 domain-containing protein [Ktedonosporobacter rubrisoli]QBD77677.1 DUF1003 domain-containing protein [Ktedonosporobacter rubrisoli]
MPEQTHQESEEKAQDVSNRSGQSALSHVERLRRLMLFHPTLYPYKPQNVNLIFKAEKAAGNFNQKVAVGMTQVFQAMPTFWLIMAWIVLWILANATIVHFDPLPWPLLLALASVPQLPLMIVIMVGQGLLGRKQELQANEQFETTMKTYHDIEQIMHHLSAQDEEIIRQTHMLIHLLQAHGISPEQFLTLQASQSNGATPPLFDALSSSPQGSVASEESTVDKGAR